MLVVGGERSLVANLSAANKVTATRLMICANAWLMTD